MPEETGAVVERANLRESVYPRQSSSGDFLSGSGFPSATAIAYRMISPTEEGEGGKVLKNLPTARGEEWYTLVCFW